MSERCYNTHIIATQPADTADSISDRMGCSRFLGNLRSRAFLVTLHAAAAGGRYNDNMAKVRCTTHTTTHIPGNDEASSHVISIYLQRNIFTVDRLLADDRRNGPAQRGSRPATNGGVAASPALTTRAAVIVSIDDADDRWRLVVAFQSSIH